MTSMTDNTPLEAKRSVVAELSEALKRVSESLGAVRIMHVCGTHEHEIARYGLRQLLPKHVRIIPGPGCPVCITPDDYIETARFLALSPEKPVLCTYGDMVRVPGPSGSLLDARAGGADIRIVYGIRDAVKTALEAPQRPVIFFSVGFETTAAPVAAVVAGGLPENLFLYTCHRYVPPAVEALVSLADDIDGFLLPGHASVITGTAPYRPVVKIYGKPAAVGGFEPEDILLALLSILRQLHEGRAEVENCYPRAVKAEGNPTAMEYLRRVFAFTDAPWRGIGVLKNTGLELSEGYGHLDARKRFGVPQALTPDHREGCRCPEVLLGKVSPPQCPFFSRECTPSRPLGPCMVSGEGTCRAAFLYPEDEV